MEGQENLNVQYQAILKIYCGIKSTNDNLTKSIKETEANISNLEAQLKNQVQQPVEEVNESDKIKVAELTSKVQEFQHLIRAIESEIINDENQFNIQVSRLNLQKSLSTVIQNVDNGELNNIYFEFSNIQKALNDQTSKLQVVEQELHHNQDTLAQLQAELAKLSEVERHQGSQTTEESSIKSLEKELHHYENTLHQLQNELNAENTNRKDQTSSLQASIKTAKEALAKGQAEVKEKQAKKQALEQQLSSNQDEKLNQLQAEIKKLEARNGQIQKDIDSLAQVVQTKKTERSAQQEQLRKYKEKKEKNYKKQIAEAEKTQQSLNKQLEREKEKLADVLKLSKTYVNQQNLQILQKELTRHQNAGTRGNIEAEEAKKAKCLKENQALKSRIQYLKNTSRTQEQQTENIVKELKKNGDELVKEKLAQQKVLTQTTNKLNEYMKQFPDHEKKKELQKLEEKRKKAEEKERIREVAREQKERKKQQQQKIKQAQAISTEQPSNETAWDKWDKWEGKNLPTKDEGSIFNNRQFQLVIAAVALLSILFLAFG